MCNIIGIYKGLFAECMNRVIAVGSAVTVASFYTVYNAWRLDQTLRYLVDLGFNIGMGDGNISEKDDVSLLVSTAWMLVGSFVFFNWCFAIVKATLGHESSGVLHRIAVASRRNMAWVSEKTQLSPNTLAVLVAVLWCAFGVSIGVFVQHWSFIKALNFAVGGMTTTGSQQVKDTPVANILCAVFLFGGVPLLTLAASVVVVPDKVKPNRPADKELAF